MFYFQATFHHSIRIRIWNRFTSDADPDPHYNQCESTTVNIIFPRCVKLNTIYRRMRTYLFCWRKPITSFSLGPAATGSLSTSSCNRNRVTAIRVMVASSAPDPRFCLSRYLQINKVNPEPFQFSLGTFPWIRKYLFRIRIQTKKKKKKKKTQEK